MTYRGFTNAPIIIGGLQTSVFIKLYYFMSHYRGITNDKKNIGESQTAPFLGLYYRFGRISVNFT